MCKRLAGYELADGETAIQVAEPFAPSGHRGLCCQTLGAWSGFGDTIDGTSRA